MTQISSSHFLIGLMFATFVGLCILFAPFLPVFIITITFGVLFNPINNRLRRSYGATGSALITILLVILSILAIATFVVVQVGGEAANLLSGIQSGTVVPHAYIDSMQANINSIFPEARIDVLSSFQSALSWLMSQAGSIFQSITTVVLNIFLSLMALYYWFKDSEKFRGTVLGILPISVEDGEAILGRLTLSVHSLIRGTLMVAVLQGISACIGFLIFGVPNPFLWASITVVCALVPTFGTTLIFVPIVVFLALSGNTPSAIGIALWGITAVGLIDNMLGPRLMSKGSNMHPFFTLLAVLGGVQLFGAIGIFAGPLLLSLFFAVGKTYTSHTAR